MMMPITLNISQKYTNIDNYLSNSDIQIVYTNQNKSYIITEFHENITKIDICVVSWAEKLKLIQYGDFN